MSAGYRGDISKLRAFEKSLRALPTVVAQKVAAESAGAITGLVQKTYAAGENAYGDTWAPDADGKRATLVKSGAAKSDARYVAIGTRLRAKLGPKYMRFQAPFRPVFPRNGAKLPVAWSNAIGTVAHRVIKRELAR